ncbi:MAG TPA: hypothetical protein VG692_19360 [Gemmatimonadales bacterium]|nr:hypothetical protein [Gemmatimonadales bacterium]
MKPVLGLAATGIVALILWKVLAAFLLPLVGVAIGFVFLAVKIGFIVGAVLLALWVFKRVNRTAEG